MTTSDRYDTSHLPENQFEPGSDGQVLKNLMGITTRDEMEVAETAELWFSEGELFKQVKEDQTFTADDICSMHRLWLGRVYSWAGEYRQVNISKAGFPFATALHIGELMQAFERKQLRKYTPLFIQRS